MLRLPPLAAIEAFVVAMNSDTFRTAAEALALSPSAFGRRIRTLETHLGTPLFERRAGRPVPTAAAHEFLQKVEPSLKALQGATRGVRATTRKNLRLLVAPSLAAEWLMPKLSERLFTARVEDFSIEVGEPGGDLDPARHDLAILAASTGRGHVVSDLLARVEAAVVAAPKLLDHRAPPATPQEIGDHARLDMRFPEGLWRRWSERSGAAMPRDRGDARFTSLTTMYEAAASGFGVALAVPLVSERRLREGTLKPCFRGVVPLGYEYRIVYRSERIRARADVRSLVSALQEAAEVSQGEFMALAA